MVRHICKIFKISFIPLTLILFLSSGCTLGSKETLSDGSSFGSDFSGNSDSNGENSQKNLSCDSDELNDHELCRFVRVRTDNGTLVQESSYNFSGKKILVESFILPNLDQAYQTYERVETITNPHWEGDNLEEVHHISRLDHDKNGVYDEIRYSYQQLDVQGKPVQEEHITVFQDLLQGENQTQEEVYYQDVNGDGSKILIDRVTTERYPNNILGIIKDSTEYQIFNSQGQLVSRIRSIKLMTPNNGWLRSVQNHHFTYNEDKRVSKIEGAMVQCNSVVDCSNGATDVKKAQTHHHYDGRGFLQSTQFLVQSQPSAPWVTQKECEMKTDSFGNELEQTCIDPNDPSNPHTTINTWLRAWEAAGLTGPTA